MTIGHLKIPKLERKKHAMDIGIGTHLWLQYLDLIEKNPIGQEILKTLKKDPRVQALEGYLISKGCSKSRFEVKTLAQWFLWAANEYGFDSAKHNLNLFLDADTIPVINTLWVLGPEVEDTITLDNGLEIRPIKNMPTSDDKELFLRDDFSRPPYHSPKPTAAITYKVHVKKSYQASNSGTIPKEDKEFWESSQKMQELSLILNALEEASCIPLYSTSYTLPEIPMGPFDSSGYSAPYHDIIGYPTCKLSAECGHQINSLLKAFNQLDYNNKTRFTRILSRLSQAKQREIIADKILDLSIALEMALLEDNKNNAQLSLTFCLRGSWLIASDIKERQRVYKQLKKIYKYRSQVAHSGILCKNNLKEFHSVQEKFPQYTELAERIIQKLIFEGKPDWSKLILGDI